MAKTFSQVRKESPAVGDVHVSSTGQGKPKKPTKAKLFSTVAAIRSNIADYLDSQNDVAKGWSLTIPITKTDEDQNLAFGWASVIEENGHPVIDAQGDVISEAELEKAFYQFSEEARQAGEMHGRIGVGSLVECMVFTKQKQEALGIDLKKVGAWVGFRLDPDVFAKVKSGEYRALSIGGAGRREILN